ncbi:MAG TPA: LysE family translocator [Pseudonocardia sp.]|jgi:threonine/homoserine/homoserine lactone efflux protein|nr:LysE family translocator [Pseudonocardia sp.]
MAVSSVVAFWAVAVLLIIVPGADWAFTIAAGMGGRSVLPAVGGLVLGYALVTGVVAAGVGALVAGSPPALTGLTLLGGAYLGWHGARTLARPATVELDTADPAGQARGPAGRARDTLVRGIGVSGLNPKGLLIFLALLPQFTDPRGGWPVAAQIGVLGAAFTLTCAVFYLGLGTFARTVLHARPSAARAVSRVAGAAMIAIGVLLVVDRLAA